MTTMTTINPIYRLLNDLDPVQKVLHTVGHYYGVSVRAITSQEQTTWKVSHARKMAAALMVSRVPGTGKWGKMSNQQVGKVLNRDHSTVMYYKKSIFEGGDNQTRLELYELNCIIERI